MPLQNNKQYSLHNAVFSTPVPGQSLTSPPKGMPYEKPPQFTKIEDAVHYVMNQVTEPEHISEFLHLIKRGISIEEMTRVIIFSGFALGKWTPDLAMLIYKPVMLGLIALAHRASLKDANVLMPKRMSDKSVKDMQNTMMTNIMVNQKANKKARLNGENNKIKPVIPEPSKPPQGFMQRPEGIS